MSNADLSLGQAADLGRHEGGIVATDRDQIADTQLEQGFNRDARELLIARRVVARGAQNRAPFEVDAGNAVYRQRLDHVRRVATHEPAEAIVNPHDLQAVVDRFNGGGADDAVDAGRRSASDQDT